MNNISQENNTNLPQRIEIVRNKISVLAKHLENALQALETLDEDINNVHERPRNYQRNFKNLVSIAQKQKMNGMSMIL